MAGDNDKGDAAIAEDDDGDAAIAEDNEDGDGAIAEDDEGDETIAEGVVTSMSPLDGGACGCGQVASAASIATSSLIPQGLLPSLATVQ